MSNSPLLKHVGMKTYVVGYALSLIFTFLAFGVVKLTSENELNLLQFEYVLPFILLLALIQLSVQLIFFMHLLKEDKPRWGLIFFISTFSLILLIVIASVWILNNLNYHMMPMDVGEYIRIDEGIKIKN